MTAQDKICPIIYQHQYICSYTACLMQFIYGKKVLQMDELCTCNSLENLHSSLTSVKLLICDHICKNQLCLHTN